MNPLPLAESGISPHGVAFVREGIDAVIANMHREKQMALLREATLAAEARTVGAPSPCPPSGS